MKELSNLLIAMVEKNEKSNGKFFECNKGQIALVKSMAKNMLDGGVKYNMDKLHKEYIDKFIEFETVIQPSIELTTFLESFNTTSNN